MSQVPEEKIEVAWRLVGAAASGDGLSELMREFGENQPAVMKFLSEASGYWESDAADLAFHSALVIWKCFHDGATFVPTSASASDLMERYQANLLWLDSQGGDPILLQRKMSELSRFSEPSLMGYVMQAIFEANEDGLEIEPDEQRQLFLALKTVVDSLEAAGNINKRC